MDSVTYFTDLLGNTYGTSFSCYFSLNQITDPTVYTEVFNPLSILQKSLYGLGQTISNVQALIELDITVEEGYLYWYKTGYFPSNSLIRSFVEEEDDIS